MGKIGAPPPGTSKAVWFGPPTIYSTADVRALASGMRSEAKRIATAYTMATTPEAKETVLREQRLTAAIDDFVRAVARGYTKLPPGVAAAKVVAPAILPLLRLGLGYSINVPAVGGGRVYNFALTPKHPGYKPDPSGVFIEVADTP